MSSNGKFELKGFVRATLTDEQKAAAKSQDPLLAFDEYVSELLQAGYKLSLNFDKDGDCFYATLTDVREGSSFRGAALSGRGPSPTGALQMLFYKHYQLFHGDWSRANGFEGDRWG